MKTIGNILWFVLAGWWLMIIHVIAAVLLAITIIGIPFAVQSIKLAALAVNPLGKRVVKTTDVEAALRNTPANETPATPPA